MNQYERPKEYSQVCVWEGTFINNDIVGFTEFMKNEFGVRIKFLEEITTKPNVEGDATGGRIDLFFAVHKEDIPKFAVPRLKAGIRWAEDVLAKGNYRYRIYPERVFDYCTWNFENLDYLPRGIN